MQGKNKYVSSLDLKYLDAKFIAIHDSQLEMSTNLNEIRKSKTSELPSIFHSKLEDDTTLYTSGLSPCSRLDSFESRPPQRYQSVGRASLQQDDLREVDKYKKMIAKIKSDNDLLHKEITNLYRQEKISTHLLTKQTSSLRKSRSGQSWKSQKQLRL